MRIVIATANLSAFTTALFGFAGVLVGALATILVGIVSYRQARSGQVTDRLTKAVEQLGSDNPQVRVGAVFALEQIASDSKPRSTAKRYRSYVAALLAALVRSNSRSTPASEDKLVLKVRAPDAQAALTVLCRPPVCKDHVGSKEPGRLDLSRSNLRRASLRDAQLQGADLSEAFLQGADLSEAKLQWAVLKEANLGPDPGSRYPDGANLTGADLTEAILDRTILDRAIWSEHTSWPAGTLSEMQARSTEVEPGKFRIRERGGRSPTARPTPSI